MKIKRRVAQCKVQKGKRPISWWLFLDMLNREERKRQDPEDDQLGARRQTPNSSWFHPSRMSEIVGQTFHGVLADLSHIDIRSDGYFRVIQ